MTQIEKAYCKTCGLDVSNGKHECKGLFPNKPKEDIVKAKPIYQIENNGQLSIVKLGKETAYVSEFNTEHVENRLHFYGGIMEDEYDYWVNVPGVDSNGTFFTMDEPLANLIAEYAHKVKGHTRQCLVQQIINTIG